MYVDLGILWWNAVSNVNTFGTPGNSFWNERTPLIFAGLCKGAKSSIESTLASSSSFTNTEAS